MNARKRLVWDGMNVLRTTLLRWSLNLGATSKPRHRLVPLDRPTKQHPAGQLATRRWPFCLRMRLEDRQLVSVAPVPESWRN